MPMAGHSDVAALQRQMSLMSMGSLREPQRGEPQPSGPGRSRASGPENAVPQLSLSLNRRSVQRPTGPAQGRVRPASAAIRSGLVDVTNASAPLRSGLIDITNVPSGGRLNKKPEATSTQAVTTAPPSPQTIVSTAASSALAAHQGGDVAPTGRQHLPLPPMPLHPPDAPLEVVPDYVAVEVLPALPGAQDVSDYVLDIFNQLYREEGSCMPRFNYMDQQLDINGKMRAILIDWLIEVHMKYRLRSETLFLAVNIIDRYLSKIQVLRKKLQLLGVVAMFIAAKFEEIDPPRVNDFVYITDSTYTRDDILTMECQVLTILSFRVVVPTAAHFFDQLQMANRCDVVQRELAAFLLELALVEMRMMRHTPSHQVASVLMLTNELFGRSITWPAEMVQVSHYSAPALRVSADEFYALLQAAPTTSLQAARKKYSNASHHAVAHMDFHMAI